ncbi:MAG: PAS domain S-box protein [Balneolaceae bacterium]|nr:PAS domain S-box protein [Balneolaceae bacterium]MCH8549549.1 PAS domain S-box protein [Balneolaceae bacterium]
MSKDRRRLNILVVEDNLGDFVLVEEFIRDEYEQAELYHARTFEEAKGLLGAGMTRFDVILLDLSLPDRNGEKLIEDILELAPDIPIVILTGHTDLDFSVKSLSKGISDYLLKDDLSPTLLYKSILYSIERNVFSSKVRESEKGYRDLFELTPQPMWIHNVHTRKFLNVNQAAVNKYGYHKDEFLEMRVDDILPDSNIPGGFSKQGRGSLFEGIFEHKTKTGEIIKVRIESSDTRYAGQRARLVLAIDITEKLKEEERLKLLESVITNSTESVVILEAEPSELPGRRILYVNDAFRAMTGFNEDEIAGKTLSFLNGPQTDEGVRQDLRKAMEEWKIAEVEFINYRKDGTPFWINMSMVPVENESGGYSHWIAIGRDVSEQKRYETELEQSLTEKEVLLSEIHHRVKNNLAVVSSMMQLQAFEEADENVARKLMDGITRISTMATIHELLYHNPSFTNLQFSEVLKKLLAGIDETMNRGVDVKHHISNNNVELNINQAIPCALVINEVVTNTYKHAFKGREKGRISIELVQKADEISLQISDDGIGFCLEEGVESVKSLGMQIIEVLSAQLGGEFDFKSSNEGTTFTLQFQKRDLQGVGYAKMHD